MHDNLWSFFFLCVHVCNPKGKQKEKLGGKREVDRTLEKTCSLHVPSGIIYFKTKKHAVISNGSLVCRTLTC